MYVDRPGVLTSTAEFEVRDASARDALVARINELLKGFVGDHPALQEAAVQAGRGATTIRLTLEIIGESFGQADAIATTLISSLIEHLAEEERSTGDGLTASPIEQTSQTLVPA